MAEKEESSNLMKNIRKPKIDNLNYGFKILSNGLKVLIISDPETNKSSASLCVNIGSLADKKDEQGLAHFCEHLLFMGTEKYPSENEYREYVLKNGGISNAMTDLDRTTYFFDISNEAFEGALDRFAQFFICPKFSEGAVGREIKAIDNEFSNNLNNDMVRTIQIMTSEIKKESPFNLFASGNLKTLSHPDIRNRLLVFYKKYYTSEIMNLCIYSNKSLDELIKLVENTFIKIPKLENFIMPRYDEVKPYDETNLKYLYKIIPIKDTNDISLNWYLPFCSDYYTNPTAFLSYIFNHEGPNTLASSLNKDNLCNGLVASSIKYCKTYINFNIIISLTKKGFENYKEVILRTLKYIKVIQNKGINKRFYDDIKEIAKLNFDYRIKLSPISATKTFSSNLIDFAPEDVLVGYSLFGEFKESLLKQYLDMLTLNNLNIYFLSKQFEKECTLTEEFYGTKYSKEKLNITEEDINSYKCEYIFDYPPENKFIPKNFDILPPPEKISDYPEKLISNKNLEVWFHQDTIFKRPIAYLICQFITPEDLCDFSEIKLRILSNLLDTIITVELGEFLYMAKAANMSINFEFGVNETNIIFKGYNDSIKEGMKNIFRLIQNLDINTERCKETLELQQKEMLKGAKNIFMNKNYQVNLVYVKDLLNEHYKNQMDVINFLEEKKIKIEDLIKYKNAIFKNSKCKWLIQGNLTKEQAMDIVEEGNKILEIDINKAKIGKFFISRPILIKKNYNFIFRTKSLNPREDSSSLISIYQTGLLNGLEFQYLKITESFLKQKFFGQIRTKEALGYIATITIVETAGCYGIANIIQSNSRTPEFCAGRVRNFYKEIYKRLKDITEEEFKMHINSQLLIVNKKNANLSEVFLRNWKQIHNNTYKFDIKERTNENMNKCNKEGFIKFFEKYFIKEKAILDCEYLCEAHYEQNEKDLKEAKILEGDNIIQRIICDNLEDFRACNCLGAIYNNSTFMLNNN